MGRFDRNQCDTASFGFLKTILFPPSIRNCIDLIRFHDESTDHSLQDELPVRYSASDRTLDLEGFNNGYHAISMLPTFEMAHAKHQAGGEDPGSSLNVRGTIAVLPNYSQDASKSQISALEPIISGKAAAVTPTRPRTTRSKMTSPISGGKSRRSPGSAWRASPSPLKILQQTCFDDVSYEAACEISFRSHIAFD